MEDNFPLSVSGRTAPLCIDSRDFAGVARVARLLQSDLARVTGTPPDLRSDELPDAKGIVLIGTLGRSLLVDRLVEEGKLDAAGLAGKREMFYRQTVDRPLPGVDCALVIAGSDKRGTLYGMLDLSDFIGVSPWQWWADVPAPKRSDLFVPSGRRTLGEPAVRCRGIFINDEAPALTKWALEKFGGFNHFFYEKVFELLLRLRGNFLWPAMWGSAFHDDDPLNPVLADEFGIIVGTSHHEPMLRAHQEWARYGTGPWNYPANEGTLREFWEQGARGIGTREVVVTVGMRGDGDLPLTAETDIALLERIIRDQREILARVTGRSPDAVPQLWAVYKEVQDYYDRGMRVPDDVTLLLCDDNWGNIRRLPVPGSKPRPGGYGLYYHFDYVGDPRNYKWLNSTQIARTWEQMRLAYRHGVDRIWIVNVGDIKPLEFPTQFFLDYAWDPDAWTAERLPEYARRWAERQFGAEHAGAIAGILSQYTRFNSRRKPELLAPDTYSLVHYREAATVVEEYNRLAADAADIAAGLPEESRDAFYQLVLHPVRACANLNELYVTIGRNRLYAAQGRAAANELAARARELFRRDADLSRYYNETLAAGKWNHMMDQTHIGYTTWQQPKENTIPAVVEIPLPESAEMGVAVEGSEEWWPQAAGEPTLPECDADRRPIRRIEIFNRGREPFEFRAEAGAAWLSVTPDRGTVDRQVELSVAADWPRVPVGTHHVPIRLAGPRGARLTVRAVVRNSAPTGEDEAGDFVEAEGVVSIEAEHYTRAVESDGVRWQCIPELGRTLSGMTTTPVTGKRWEPGGGSPRLEYRMRLLAGGPASVHAFFSPTLDYLARGLRYAVSFDADPPQIVDLWPRGATPSEPGQGTPSRQAWEKAVADNITIGITGHTIAAPGFHVLKYWLVDPGVVLQKIVVDAGGLRPSYLGPPESYRRRSRNP